MNYRLLAKAAKTAVDKRGGTDALKQDFSELQKIAKGKGSVATKAGKAVAALGATKQAESAKPPTEAPPQP